MFQVRSELNLAHALIGVLTSKQNLNRVKTSLISNNIFKLDFAGNAELILCSVDPIYYERSEDPSENIKPVTVRVTKLLVSDPFIEVSISYNAREHTFICKSFQYSV